MHFAIGDQLRVWNVVERNMSLALDSSSALPEVLELDGVPRECRAHTRKGTPCQREPLPGRDYCPSHKHLEETFEAGAAVEAIEHVSARSPPADLTFVAWVRRPARAAATGQRPRARERLHDPLRLPVLRFARAARRRRRRDLHRRRRRSTAASCTPPRRRRRPATVARG